MTEHDPAARRFLAINLARLAGVACVIAGMLVATARILPQLPHQIGYVLIGIGLIGVFVIPVVMARKWRSR